MQTPALLKDGYRLGQAVVRVLADSTKTHEIHRAEEITGRRRFRTLLAEMKSTPEGRRLLAERPEFTRELVDYGALRTLPESTLGGAYVRHLDSHGLTADYQAAATRYVDDPDIAYLMRRFRQTHDVWHVLIGLGVEGYEEVLVHWFSYGQLRLPVSAMVMTLGTLKHIVLEKRWDTLRHSALEAYRVGRNAEPLLPVYWEDHWERPLDEIQARYRVQPLERRYLH